MKMTLSGSAPIPPRIPNTLWIHSGRLGETLVEEIGQIVKVPDVIALVLIARAEIRHQVIDARHVAERVAKDERLAVLDVLFLPWKLPVGDLSRPSRERRNSSSPC